MSISITSTATYSRYTNLTPYSICPAAGSEYASDLCLIPEEEEIVYFGCSEDEFADAEWLALFNNNEGLDIFDNPALIHQMSASHLLRDHNPSATHKRALTLPYVETLIKATRARRLRQRSGFMFPSPDRRGDDMRAGDDVVDDSAAPRVGGTQCNTCISRPSHRLIPCHHIVCYDHFLTHPEGTSLRCARCLKSVTDTLEIDATGDSSINDLAFSTQDLRLSPSISIWGSPTLSTNSNTAIFQPLNSAIANMRAPTVEAAHDGATTHGLPPAGHEERLGETNRDHIDTKHSRTQSGSQGAPSQQAQSAQVQNGQRQLPYHNRFRSFNPTRPASANFPEHVDSTQSQQVESNQAQRTARDFTNQHTVSNHAQHGPSGGAQQMPFQIHAPQPSSFRASQAFRELATPAPMVANTRAAPPMQQFSHQMQQGHGFSQQPMNMQHYPGPVQHSTAMLPLGNDFGHRALLSPVNVQGPFGLPHMAPMANIAAGPANFNPYAQHNGGSAVDPMMYGFSPIQMNGHNINGPQMSGAHVPGPPFTGPQMNGTQMYGAQTKGLYNNGPHNNGPHMNSPHNNVPHINSPYMNGTNFGGPQMNGGRLPGRDFFTQGDPFVENQQAMPGARPTGRDYNLRGNYSTGPSPVNSLVNGSSNGSSYGYQQNNGFANNHQQPLTEAARQAQLIKSGTLDQRNTVTPPRGRGLVSPGSDGTGSEYAVQSVVRSQVVMAPEIRPDPSWLTDGETPTLDQAYEHLPFVDDAANSSPSTAGVIKISNIPYTTTKNEVIAALGKSTRITSQPPRTPYYAIHIIMERSTGKTMDVYVELESAAEAKDAVDAFQQRCMVNRQPRIGDRHIDITLSSQEELMGELFPRAKCVRWEGSVPVVYETSEPYNSGFQGFLSGEELVMITKHAETPQRSPFAQRCVNRTYETMISLMHKYPWHSTSNITIGQRSALFKTATTQLRVLINAVNHISHPRELTRSLLQEYLTAMLSNPGFSVQQKTYVLDIAQNAGFGNMLGLIPFTHVPIDMANWWAFEILGKQPDISNLVLDAIIQFLRRATDPASFAADQHSALSFPGHEFGCASYWGYFFIRYPREREHCSLMQAAEAEVRAVHEALCRVLPVRAALEGGAVGGGQGRGEDGFLG